VIVLFGESFLSEKLNKVVNVKKRRNRRMSSRNANDEELHAKLNAIIRLLIELNRNMNKDEFNIRSTAKMLHSVGLAPKEIANILGV